MATFVVLKDGFGDTHASELRGEANREAIERTARELCDSLGLGDEEQAMRVSIAVGIVSARDAGAARLQRVSIECGDGGVVWHGWLRPNGAYEQGDA